METMKITFKEYVSRQTLKFEGRIVGITPGFNLDFTDVLLNWSSVKWFAQKYISYILSISQLCFKDYWIFGTLLTDQRWKVSLIFIEHLKKGTPQFLLVFGQTKQLLNPIVLKISSKHEHYIRAIQNKEWFLIYI